MSKSLFRFCLWLGQGVMLLLLTLFIPCGFLEAEIASAGPVEWKEVPATEAGQQWWDIGSLHYDKDGNLSVLSRFTPALREGEKQQNGSLYLMHVDCDQKLFRDTSVNGLHRFRAEWKPSDGDELIDAVIDAAEREKADLLVVDSVQVLYSESVDGAPGGVGQVRECAARLVQFAKRSGTVLLLVGHVTKEGMLAGPKVLEHLVDAVLTFEGDRFASHRLLRAVKNRFGATHELGVFEMQGKGLAEVGNPSELFLKGESASGVATIVAFEGTRSLVVDLQALVGVTSYASPRRTATGLGTNRLHQILAVLEKHMGLPLSRYDCYLAVAGGLEVEEPAADLGVAAAVVSSYRDLMLPKGTVLLGELGLGGQLRPVGQLGQRLKEAVRLGFHRAVVPQGSGLGPIGKELELELLEAASVTEALVMALGVNPADDCC